jgi:MYXO-CTERM domain-containing protein
VVDGVSRSCAPYRCRDGACMNHCQSIDDCADPNDVCRSNGTCGPFEGSPGKGTCSLSSGSPASSAGGFAVLVAVVAIAMRRKRYGSRLDI